MSTEGPDEVRLIQKKTNSEQRHGNSKWSSVGEYMNASREKAYTGYIVGRIGEGAYSLGILTGRERLTRKSKEEAETSEVIKTYPGRSHPSATRKRKCLLPGRWKTRNKEKKKKKQTMMKYGC